MNHYRKYKLTFVCIILYCFAAVPSVHAGLIVFRGESLDMPFQVERVARQKEVPWGMAFLDAETLIFTLRDGGIRLLNPKTGRINKLQVPELNIKYGGQGGMLDVSVPPDYQVGEWIYFTFSRNVEGEGATALARARFDGSRLAEWQDLLVSRSRTDKSRHFGSRIAFDGAGHIFLTIGDRGVRPNGQDLSNHAGSILRLNRDGTVPRDNPFVGKNNVLSEIYSYGHRNPQGIVFDHATGRLWAIEHGPRGGDEINLILPGRNYGWPVISYGKEYWGPVQVGEGSYKEGMEQPLKQYTPSIAPGSLLLYTGKAFENWQGSLFAGALAMTHLNRVEVDPAGRIGSEERLLEDMDKRIRSLAQSREGWIYFSTDEGDIYRIRPRS